MNLKLHVFFLELSLTVMNDEVHGVRLMLLCKTGNVRWPTRALRIPNDTPYL